jgi:hypothetical protein
MSAPSRHAFTYNRGDSYRASRNHGVHDWLCPERCWFVTGLHLSSFNSSRWADSFRTLSVLTTCPGDNVVTMPRRATRDRAHLSRSHTSRVAPPKEKRHRRRIPCEGEVFNPIQSPPQGHSRPAFARPNIASGSAGERSRPLTQDGPSTARLVMSPRLLARARQVID